MFRFTIRELVLLTLVVAMGVGWWLDRRDNLENDVIPYPRATPGPVLEESGWQGRAADIASGEAGTTFLRSQLVYHAPALLVYAVALILAAAYVRRASVPYFLMLIGMVIMVLSTVGGALAHASLLDFRDADWLSGDRFARNVSRVSLAANYVRSTGLALLVAAVFAGRRTASQQASPLP